jgi:hypothetical protein
MANSNGDLTRVHEARLKLEINMRRRLAKTQPEIDPVLKPTGGKDRKWEQGKN